MGYRKRRSSFSDPVNAYKIVTGQTDTTNIVDRYQRNYKVWLKILQSVKDNIAKQEKGYRLNFFVDEVGQFIADNTRLMLNLQTIAESLNTFCKGQAWIV